GTEPVPDASMPKYPAAAKSRHPAPLWQPAFLPAQASARALPQPLQPQSDSAPPGMAHTLPQPIRHAPGVHALSPCAPLAAVPERSPHASFPPAGSPSQLCQSPASRTPGPATVAEQNRHSAPVRSPPARTTPCEAPSIPLQSSQKPPAQEHHAETSLPKIAKLAPASAPAELHPLHLFSSAPQARAQFPAANKLPDAPASAPSRLHQRQSPAVHNQYHQPQPACCAQTHDAPEHQ